MDNSRLQVVGAGESKVADKVAPTDKRQNGIQNNNNNNISVLSGTVSVRCEEERTEQDGAGGGTARE